MAKRILRLAYFLSRELENNPKTRDIIRVLFMEDYNVSLAEVLIPAAELETENTQLYIGIEDPESGKPSVQLAMDVPMLDGMYLLR